MELTISRPRLRMLEMIPTTGSDGETVVVLRDPEGMAETAVLSYGAALLASLMDGQRTQEQISAEFQAQVGQEVPDAQLTAFVAQLDQQRLLEGDAFRAHRERLLSEYFQSPVRPAAHAGGAYETDPDALRRQLGELFTCDEGPGAVDESNATVEDGPRLRGILSPHIDLHRGGTTFAWAYKRVAEQSDARLFVIFGTAHGPMRQLFSVSRKHFATPLGTVETDQAFIDSLAGHLDRISGNGQSAALLFEDEAAHRVEHSIEFQFFFLQ